MNYPNNSETFKFAKLRKKTMPYLKHMQHSNNHELSKSPRNHKEDNTRFLDVRITADINRIHPPKHMNISIQMPITAQIIINPNKGSPENTYKPKRAIIRNYSQYDKCSSSVYRKNMQSTPETVIRAYMSLINKNNQVPKKEYRSRGSLILEPAEEKKKPHKSVSQLRMRLPSMGGNKTKEADGNQITRIRKNIIQSFHIMKKANHKSMSILPLTTNKVMKIEGKQISGEYKSTNMSMHLKRKSTIGPEYSSSISRNPFMEGNNKFPTESKILASWKPTIDEVYTAMGLGREEIRLLPTLKIRELLIKCTDGVPLYICDHEVLP